MVLQCYKFRVSDDLPRTASLVHFACISFQRDLSTPKVHNLGQGLQSTGSPYPGLLLGSIILVVPSSLLHSCGTVGGSTAADRGDSDLSGVDWNNVVASVGQAEE